VESKQQRRPDWVRCASCWTIYAPELQAADACPKCGNKSWIRTAIPDGATPLQPPIQPRL
jgi:predicted RNA-binding Zn-ribbon protein involved in translation (DUF1610 family)